MFNINIFLVNARFPLSHTRLMRYTTVIMNQVAVLDADGIQIETKRFATTRESFLLIAAELREGDTAALEVTTNSTSIARLLRAGSKARVIVSNPIKTKTIAQAKIKTDKIDARVLAELARVGYLPEVWLPDEDTEALRQFITDRVSRVRRTDVVKTAPSIGIRRKIYSCLKLGISASANLFP